MFIVHYLLFYLRDVNFLRQKILPPNKAMTLLESAARSKLTAIHN